MSKSPSHTYSLSSRASFLSIVPSLVGRFLHAVRTLRPPILRFKQGRYMSFLTACAEGCDCDLTDILNQDFVT